VETRWTTTSTSEVTVVRRLASSRNGLMWPCASHGNMTTVMRSRSACAMAMDQSGGRWKKWDGLLVQCSDCPTGVLLRAVGSSRRFGVYSSRLAWCADDVWYVQTAERANEGSPRGRLRCALKLRAVRHVERHRVPKINRTEVAELNSSANRVYTAHKSCTSMFTSITISYPLKKNYDML
jgi:hypothetical protein